MPRLTRADAQSRTAVAEHAVVLFLVGGALAVNQFALAGSGHTFISTCVDAVVLIVTLNLAAFVDDGRGNRRAADAFAALGLAATIPLAGAALPLRHLSAPAGTLILAATFAASALYFASRRHIQLRPLLARGARTVQLVVTVLAAGVLSFCAFLLRAPELGTSHPARAVLALTALVASAVTEELLFRGVVQPSLERVLGRNGVVLAILVSSAFYASFGWWMLAALAATTMFAIAARSTGLGSAIVAHLVFVVGATAVWPAVFDHRRPGVTVAVFFTLVFSAAVVGIVAKASRGPEHSRV